MKDSENGADLRLPTDKRKLDIDVEVGELPDHVDYGYVSPDDIRMQAAELAAEVGESYSWSLRLFDDLWNNLINVRVRSGIGYETVMGRPSAVSLTDTLALIREKFSQPPTPRSEHFRPRYEISYEILARIARQRLEDTGTEQTYASRLL